MDILEFQGEHRYLSNFYLCSFVWDGVVWPHAEAAYQAAKSEHWIVRKSFLKLSPSEAKRKGKQILIRPDWDDVKLEVMAEIVYAKFTQNPDLLERLLATTGELVEGNAWKDRFWGVCPVGSKNGSNHLGRILMELRQLYNKTEVRGIVSF